MWPEWCYCRIYHNPYMTKVVDLAVDMVRHTYTNRVTCTYNTTYMIRGFVIWRIYGSHIWHDLVFFVRFMTREGVVCRGHGTHIRPNGLFRKTNNHILLEEMFFAGDTTSTYDQRICNLQEILHPDTIRGDVLCSRYNIHIRP